MNNQPIKNTPIQTIELAPPRQTVQVTFSDGQILRGPVGSTVEDFIKSEHYQSDLTPIACLLDGKLRELNETLTRDSTIEILTLARSDGRRVYRRSLSLLLVAAAREVFPNVDILIDYGLNFGALYCEVRGRPPFSKAELQQLEAKMHEYVAADVPIKKEYMPLENAKKLLSEFDDKVSLLKARRKSYLVMYSLGQYQDYLHGYMVPSTGYLRTFGLAPYTDGFVLRYPNKDNPTKLKPIVDYPLLVRTYEEYGDWMDKLGIRNVGALNEAIRHNNILEPVLIAEALQEHRITQISNLIASLHQTKKLVLISGPSSAGKTTFSKRLAIQLLVHGIQPLNLGLDNFFVDRLQTPLDDDGDYDYESLYALRLKQFNETLLSLMRGEEVILPHYDFLTGQQKPGETVQISSDQIIIVEGIHGMNPDLVPYIPPEKIFRIYVSAITQLNMDRHNRISTTDTRLLRRIVRDAQHRGYTATDTLTRWPKVRQGEHTWIFPYQENADVIFNSALAYELAVLKPLAEPLLRQVKPGTKPRVEVKRLLSFLQWFESCPLDLIPANSLLREFVGGSVLRDYHAGFK